MFMRLRDKRAFTLIEIMIVVAIIGLLVAIAVPNYLSARRKAKENVDLGNQRIVKDAIYAYMVDTPAVDETDDVPAAPGTGTWGAFLRNGDMPIPAEGGSFNVGGTYGNPTVTAE